MSHTVLSSKRVKIKKPRNCWGCTRLFPTHTLMTRTVSVYDEIVTCYTCIYCEKIICLDIDYIIENDGLEYGYVTNYYNDKLKNPEQVLESLINNQP